MRKFIYIYLLVVLSICYAQTDDSFKVYNDGEVAVIKITMDPSDLVSMFDNPESDLLNLCSVHFKNTEIDEIIDSVGIRIRGNTSRVSQKKSFKLSFNTFVPGRKFYSLEKLNLNGEHNDPSIARSKICWDFFNDFGIISSRAAHAAVYINEHYYGLYVSVEHVDENFISKNFNDDTGNLWKCLFGADLTYINDNPDSYKYGGSTRVYDLKTNNDSDDYSILANVIGFLNNSDYDSFKNEFQEKFNILSVVQYFAANVLLGSWDDYWALSNNYYLYHDPTADVINIIPYDYDNTLGVTWTDIDWSTVSPYTFGKIVDGPRPLIERLLEIPEFRNLYTHVLEFYIGNYLSTSLAGNSINDLKYKLYPYAVDDTYRMLDYGFLIDDFNDSFFKNDYNKFHVRSSIEDFVNQRISSLTSQLEYVEADPIVYDIDIYPKFPDEYDSVYVDCSVFSHNSIKSVTIDVINCITEEVITYTAYSSSKFNSLLISENDNWKTVLPPLGKGFIGDMKFKIEDNNGNSTIYPSSGIRIITPGTDTKEVLISEIMSSNTVTISDNFGEYDDWLEIYNPQDTVVNLSGKYLTDKKDNLKKWQFPENVRINPNSYIIIWCDEDQEQAGPHINFKLSSDGEFVAIVDNDGVTIIDSVSFPSLGDDESYVRDINSDDWFISNSPSPGNSNLILDASQIPNEFSNSITAYPNPFNPSTIIEYELVESMNVKFNIYDILGREIWTSVKQFKAKGKHKFEWNASSESNANLVSGLYFLQINADSFNKTIKLVLLR